ncbi:MAG: type IV pilus assembly protein PilY1, partial [Gammaproteobacteria bacterium]
AGGYLPATGPYTFFDVLRAVLKRVLDPLDGVQIGFMVNHANNCTGSVTAGPGITKCSNGGYVLYGFEAMNSGSDDPVTFQTTGEDADKIALFDKLGALPTPGGTLNHSFQGKELYFELFRYLTGQGVYNAHLGFNDFGDTDKNSPLSADFPAIAPDADITETHPSHPKDKYISPIDPSGCGKIFVINLMFQVANQEDDSDDDIKAAGSSGGMTGINLQGKNNSFDTVIRYLKDIDLGNGAFGDVGDLVGKQNVVSYFFVDPTKINTTTNGYAGAGGTGVALPLSDNPDELVAALSNIFKSILSVSTTFVAPSVPVNVFNRAETVNEVFLALFQAEENGLPFWEGNLKKLRIAKNADGVTELQDVNGINAIDIDGRLKRQAVTFWTSTPDLPAAVDDQVEGADGRSVPRGGAGQRIPGFISGTPATSNVALAARQVFVEDPSIVISGLRDLNADASTADELWTKVIPHWSPAASSATYAGATAAEKSKSVNIMKFARGLADDAVTPRSWMLGDPLHSRPRPVNYGARGAHSAANPDIRILMGTNDGAMHFFRNTDAAGAQLGRETWAFYPQAVLDNLDRLRLQAAGAPVHPIGVDGSPVVLTIDTNADGTIDSSIGDKAYAYFGLRRGGKAYYALDVSNPDSPKLLWKIEKGAAGSAFAELAQSWSTPQIGHVKVGASVIPVLIFGAGYNGDDDGDDIGDLGKDAKNRATRSGSLPTTGTDDDEGRALFIVNALDGTLVWKAANVGGSGYNTVTKTLSHSDLNDSVPSEVSAVDTNGDGLLDRVYFGDTGGVLWRSDLAGLTDHDSNSSTPKILVANVPSLWSLRRILTVGRHAPTSVGISTDRRFFNRPDIVQSRDNVGPFDAVILGTGDREDPLGSTTNNVFYLLKDRATTSGIPPGSMLDETDLADLTSNCLGSASCGSPPDLANGWFIRLSTLGEKNLAAAVTAGGTIFFTTFTPTAAANSCGLSEGQGRLFAVKLQDATAVFNFDTTNDNPSLTEERADLLESGGIPVEVVPLGGGLVLVQGQEAGQNILAPGGKTSFRTYWHERYE